MIQRHNYIYISVRGQNKKSKLANYLIVLCTITRHMNLALDISADRNLDVFLSAILATSIVKY